jgi:hypothetical protein
MTGITLNHSPLQAALDSWATRDDMGGFPSALAADVSEGHAYRALGAKGKFAANLRREGKILTLVP